MPANHSITNVLSPNFKSNVNSNFKVNSNVNVNSYVNVNSNVNVCVDLSIAFLAYQYNNTINHIKCSPPLEGETEMTSDGFLQNSAYTDPRNWKLRQISDISGKAMTSKVWSHLTLTITSTSNSWRARDEVIWYVRSMVIRGWHTHLQELGYLKFERKQQ